MHPIETPDKTFHDGDGVSELRHNRRRWFCSEWCAAALGLPDGWRWSPNDLAAIVSALKRES